MIKNRLKGKPDRCILNINNILKNGEDLYQSQVNVRTEQKRVSIFGEICQEQIQDTLQGMFGKNEEEIKEQDIINRTLKKSKDNTSPVIINFKKRINNCIETIKNDYNISLKDWDGRKILSMQPFSKEHSKNFFISLNVKDMHSVIMLLDENPKLIYDVNNVFLPSIIRYNKLHFILQY